MDRLALIGVSYRRGGAAALEAWQGHLQSWEHEDIRALGFEEVMLLQTCNRCDLLVLLEPSMGISEAKGLISPPDWPRCYAYVGEGAVEQMARIASSLDSLNPGEYQIITQVREAFAAAEKAGTLGKHSRFALTTALRIAKRIRSEVELAPLNTSLFSLARPELDAHLSGPATVAVLGAGEMGQLATRVMLERPQTRVLLINRRLERAEAFAESLHVTAAGSSVVPLSLAAFQEALGGSDAALGDDASPLSPTSLASIEAMVCATPVSHLVGQEMLDGLPGLKVVVDLGIPRNVDGAAVAASTLKVLDVDTLQAAGDERRDKIETNLGLAEELLLEELDEAIGEWLEKQLGPSIKLLRERYVDTVADVCDTLDDKVQNRLASRMAHVPIKGLRALAREFGLDAARTFLEAAELTRTQ